MSPAGWQQRSMVVHEKGASWRTRSILAPTLKIPVTLVIHVAPSSALISFTLFSVVLLALSVVVRHNSIQHTRLSTEKIVFRRDLDVWQPIHRAPSPYHAARRHAIREFEVIIYPNPDTVAISRLSLSPFSWSTILGGLFFATLAPTPRACCDVRPCCPGASSFLVHDD